MQVWCTSVLHCPSHPIQIRLDASCLYCVTKFTLCWGIFIGIGLSVLVIGKGEIEVIQWFHYIKWIQHSRLLWNAFSSKRFWRPIAVFRCDLLYGCLCLGLTYSSIGNAWWQSLTSSMMLITFSSLVSPYSVWRMLLISESGRVSVTLMVCSESGRRVFSRTWTVARVLAFQLSKSLGFPAEWHWCWCFPPLLTVSLMRVLEALTHWIHWFE